MLKRRPPPVPPGLQECSILGTDPPPAGRRPVMSTPSPSNRQLRCTKCGRTIAVSDDDVARYTLGGRWPRHCGVAATLVVGNKAINPSDGTNLEGPALPR